MIVAAGAGVENWFLGVMMVLVGIALMALGLILGLVHLVGGRRPRAAA